MELEIAYFKSPISNLKIIAKNDIIVSVEFCDEFQAREIKGKNLALCLSELDAYFSGKLKKFSAKFALSGSEFTKSVYGALLDVSYGQTATYAQIAKAIGRPKATRAVGNANSRNKIVIIVPCHRIIGANGLGGYSAPGGLETKKFLLDLERSNI